MENFKTISSIIKRGEQSNIIPHSYHTTGVSIHREYCNGSNNPITVFTRSGLRHTVRHVSNAFNSDPLRKGLSSAFSNNTIYPVNNEFWIKETWVIGKNEISALCEYYSRMIEDDLIDTKSAEFAIATDIIEKFHAEKSRNGAGSATIHNSRITTRPEDLTYIGVFDYCIKLNDLDPTSYYYDPKSDVVISFSDAAVTRIHPAFMAPGEFDMVSGKTPGVEGLNVAITIIDNENQCGERYISLGKEVHKVPISKDPTKDSGVYFNVFEYNSATDSARSIRSEVHSFENAKDAIGLHNNKEDAMVAGNPSIALEENVARLKHDLEIAQIENKRHEHALKVKEAEMRHDNILMENYYSERSLDRKDRSEMIKFIPGLIAGGAAIWMMAQKFKN